MKVRKAMAKNISSTSPDYDMQQVASQRLGLDLDVLAQTESVFALSNGHFGLRANLDDGESHALSGTQVAGFYEKLPLPYSEAG